MKTFLIAILFTLPLLAAEKITVLNPETGQPMQMDTWVREHWIAHGNPNLERYPVVEKAERPDYPVVVSYVVADGKAAEVLTRDTAREEAEAKARDRSDKEREVLDEHESQDLIEALLKKVAALEARIAALEGKQSDIKQ